MALISCPECARSVSDRATACPHCGYPLAQSVASATIDNILPGRRWIIQSQTLGEGRVLEADFSHEGTFSGVVHAPPNDFFLRTQHVGGAWQLAAPLLTLAWDWVQNSGAYHEEVPIELTGISQERLDGIDRWFRSWRFDLAE